jgi:hypothetical protein
MDAIFALIFIVYILSAVVQAVLGKDARKRRQGAGEPWPGTHPPDKTSDEGAHVPNGFPFPFPFEDMFEEKHEEKPSRDDLEQGDVTAQPMDYYDRETVTPWEDKNWGSLGKSLEGQSFEEIERDEFYSLQIADDFADDFDSMALIGDDIAEFMALSEPAAFEGWKLTSKSAVIQGIIMSEVLKRPEAFSRYPVIRK